MTFQGEPGSGVSFFLVNNEPGAGPDLHRHPYPETWIVDPERRASRQVRTRSRLGPGDIAVVSAETPHKFKNIGTGRLDILCIHPSPRIIQEDLE